MKKLLKIGGKFLVLLVLSLVSLNSRAVTVSAASKVVYFIKEIGFISSFDGFKTPNGFVKNSLSQQDNYILSDSNNKASSGNYIYCIEPGVHLDGDITIWSNNDVSSLFRNDKGVTTPNQKKELISLLAARSGFMKTWEGSEGWKSKTKYLVGQILIWEIVGGARDSNFDLISPGYSLKNVYHFKDWNGETPGTASEIKAYFNDRYDTWVNEIRTILKEEKGISYADGGTYELPWDSSSNKFSKSFVDKNKVTSLFNYTYSRKDEIWSSKSSDGNTLTFATYDGVSIPKSNPLTITFTGKTSKVSSSLQGWVPSGGRQKIVSFGGNSSSTISSNIKVYTKDNPKKGGIKIVKYDPILGKNIPIPNVEFEIKANKDIISSLDSSVLYKKGASFGTVKTNSKGVATLLDLYPGEYSVVEKNNPVSGYIFDSTVKIVNVVGLEQDDLENLKGVANVSVPNKSENIVGRLKITKLGENSEKLSGVEFTIKAAEKITDPSGTAKVYYEKGDTVATGLVTNSSGEIVYYKKGNASLDKDLALHPGKYEVIETKAKDGYILDSSSHIVDIVANKNSSVEVIDVSLELKNTETELRFSKIDSDTGVNIEGAELELVDIASGEVVDSWVSSKNAHVINKLIVGKEYRLVEKKAPVGYLASNSIDFTVDNSKEGQDIKMSDNKVVGNIIIIKKGEVVKEFKENSFVYKEAGLPKVTFDVYAEEDIKDISNGNIIYKKDEKVDSIVTSNGGKGTSKDLPLGKYYVVESVTLEGFIARKEISKVSLAYKDDKTKVVYGSIALVNDRKNVSVSVIKKDIDSDKVLSGAEFTIYAKEDIKNIFDGVIVKKGTPIETVVTGENGVARFVSDFPLGAYEIKETKSPVGYASSDEVIDVLIEDNEDNEVIELSYEFKNSVTNVEFTKLDLTTSKELPGATLQVVDKNGEIVEEWVSTDKPHIIKGLLVGESYKLVETFPAKGYVTSESVDFIVKDTGVVQSIVMKDDITKFSISKKSVTGEDELPGAKLSIKDKDGNTVEEWVSTDEPHYIEKLIVGEEYTLTELIPAEGYVTASDIKFIVEDTGDVQKVVMIDEITKVEIKKVDVDGNYVSGAELEIIDKETEEVVGTVLSGEESFIFENTFVVGKTYILRERTAPSGYVKALDVEFTIKDTSEIQLVQMVDKKVTVTKVDITNSEELPGAEISVKDKETGEEVDKWVSTDEPHDVVGLEEGKEYVLTEILAPEGYYTTESIEFKVDSITEEGIKINQHYTMEDTPILTDLIITKLDKGTGSVITGNGFEFSLYRDKECTDLVESVKADKGTGMVTFSGLRYGTYYVKETKAPFGYIRSDVIEKVVLDDNTKGVGERYGISYTNEKITIETIEKVVKTGDNSNLLGYGALFLLSVFIMVGVVIKKLAVKKGL